MVRTANRMLSIRDRGREVMRLTEREVRGLRNYLTAWLGPSKKPRVTGIRYTRLKVRPEERN